MANNTTAKEQFAELKERADKAVERLYKLEHELAMTRSHLKFYLIGLVCLIILMASPDSLFFKLVATLKSFKTP